MTLNLKSGSDLTNDLSSMFVMNPLPAVSVTSASWAAISNNQF